MARSRQETHELRQELQGAMGQVAPAGARGVAVRNEAAPPAEPQVAAPAPPAPSMARAEGDAEARLTQLEEDQQLLKDKVDEQYQTKVESASKYRVKLSGIALVNMFGNTGRSDNQDVPNMALARGATTTGGDFGGTVRQSEIGLEAFGPTLGGARTSANLQFDFFGGFPTLTDGVTTGYVRMRTATVRMDWERSSLVIGQEAPFISLLSPTSFAALGYPDFSYSGNLWTWIPQARIEHRMTLSEADQLSLQAGILDPLSGEPPSSEYHRAPQAGEASRQPAYATRLGWIHGDASHAITLGAGGYYSRQNYGAGRTVDSWAGTADWNLPLGNRFELSGEFYRGRALGGLGAAQGRSVLFSGPVTSITSSIDGLNTIGGWSQLKFKANRFVEFNAAYGEDNPFSDDFRDYAAPSSYGYTFVSRNQSEMFNVIYRPRSDLIFALEYRRLKTLQISSENDRVNHVNLSVGFLF